MAKRVTDQEKKLWIRNIRDGYTVDDIVAISGRSKNTIYKYTLDQNTPKKQEPIQIESMNELDNYCRDGVDWSNNSYEDMSISEKSAYEFIESGGCNGMHLWDSETRRSLALEMMQYSDQVIIDPNHSLKYMAYKDDIKKWSKWLAPIAADWALTEGCETYDTARIYGLTATTCLWFYIHTSTATFSISQILSGVNEEQKESLRAQLFLALYHYLGVRIAAHLKNNTNISKLNTGDFSEGKQAFLLGYTHAICGENQTFNRLARVNICKNVLRVILPSGNNDLKKTLSVYIKKGCETAHEDLLFKKAKHLDLNFRHEKNIQKHLDFLIRHNYITANS